MNRKLPSSHDDDIQLKQKLIHYKAELNHYKQQVRQFERTLEQEKENTAFWRNKHSEALISGEKDAEIEELEKQLNLVKNELIEQRMVTDGLKQKLTRRAPPQPIQQERFLKSDLIAFFMYSIIWPEQTDDPIMVVGNVVIRNQTTKPLHAPILCLKVNQPSAAQLSGKMTDPGLDDTDTRSGVLQESSSEQWYYALPNWKEKIKQDGEYWLKPSSVSIIPPGGLLSFDSFQLSVTPGESISSILFQGYLYTDEWKEGTALLNKIILNFPV